MTILATPWRHFREKHREFGWLYAAQRALFRVVPRFLFSVEAVVICRVELAPFAGETDHADGLRWAAADDLEALARFGSSPAKLKARFARGTRVGILERDGQVLAWNWAETGRHDQYGWLSLRLSETDVWSFDGWVEPACRGQGLFPQVKRFMAAEYARSGHTRMLSWIDALNRNQIHANRALGGRLIGRIYALRILGFTLVRAAGRTRFGWWVGRRRLELPVTQFDRPLA